jgi:hypothetical protein
MDRMNNFEPGVIQPGMEQLIEAGDTLEVMDENGRVFAVTAVEGTAVVDFCKAFDNWLTMHKSNVQGPVMEMAYKAMLDRFGKLPLRVQRELPSWKTLGIGV